MLPQNDYILLKDYELNKLPVILAMAEEHRLLSEAGLRLGHLLVKEGQGLEQRYAPMTLSRASEPM
jgi:hypothetical protein